MEYCERLLNCPFFNFKLKELPHTADNFKKMYCLKPNPSCARLLLFRKCGADAVPVDLFPNDFMRAEDIIRKLAGA